jgi:hypothetical protein
MVRDPLDTQEAPVVSIYQRGKSWYYDFQYSGERYTGCIGAVSKTVAKEILAKKKTEAVEGRYTLPSHKPSTAWQKSPHSLRGEGTPLIGPFERFGHRCVKVRDERQDAGA